jgi:crossover junction endodeoxyribonuclease RusA
VSLAFVVPGVPAPQGSKNPYGGEANPRTRPWRAAVSAAAAEEMHGKELLWGPLYAHVVFVMPRPKSHYRANGELRPDAPIYHAGTPDLDKLQRAIGDSLSGIAIHDDKQIAEWQCEKVYGHPARAIIQVKPLYEGLAVSRRAA